MPLQNRVTPFGEIIAVPDRGTMMGNRGLLHDAQGRIRRHWALKRWLICVLEFRGRHRQVMTPGRYTELFFLDEATALAAGHRPCAECQRARFVDFRNAWAAGLGRGDDPSKVGATAIDERLHEERIHPSGSQRVFQAKLGELPDGVFITMGAPGGEAFLVQGSDLLPWSPGGYRGRCPRHGDNLVTVLTPKSTVLAIQAGYRPAVHPTAD